MHDNGKTTQVECYNEECGWAGDINDAVHPKHDPDFICCPECHERVYPHSPETQEVQS